MAIVLIEYYLNGCDARLKVVAVTQDPQFAYDWLNTDVGEFINRETLQVPFYTTP